MAPQVKILQKTSRFTLSIGADSPKFLMEERLRLGMIL